MASKSPIPLATLGANPEVAKQIQALLLPEYDLVHICLTPTQAVAELPPLCAGALDTPDSSGLGSNAALPAGERRVPRGIIFGGGVGDEDLERVMRAVRERVPEEDGGVKVVRVTREDVLAKGATGPSAGVIGEVLREKLAGLVQRGEL
ncbi:hypothetical protein NEMBOFW57_010343 [Staphylotrichum longicolle]|uniref:Uncharacterized protein n=1 Tax=Staphylotrichum longicolle TaxID=669026 RepID=A0AAD4EMZ6_9PEZI|nr:hypothetical protein NEMBOFW57_010343 [Staphylotrichum longicolle]